MTRSQIMARIHSSKTGPELLFQKELNNNRIHGWEANKRGVIGIPDIIFEKQGIVIFIHGCFWHRCLIHYRLPKTNRKYWKNKIKKNIRRDRRVNKELKKLGYIVLIIWECELKNNILLQQQINKIKKLLKREFK